MTRNTTKLVPQEEQSADDIKPAIACDIETVGLGGDYIIGGLKPENQPVSYYKTAKELVREFLTRKNVGSELVFHNADYDMRYVLPEITDYDTEICVNGTGRIIYCKIRKNNHIWYIRDSYALMPEKLAKLAPLAGMEKLDIGLADGVIFNPDDSLHMEYLERDITMLAKAYYGYCSGVFDAYQIAPARTAGSTAIKAFRRTINKVYYRQRKEVETTARNGYFGGLTFLRTIKPVTDVVKIDANAMYAASMRKYGAPVRSAIATDVEIKGAPGIYRCRVTAPEDIPFTFVPMRTPKGVIWPSGKFVTILPTITIDLARKYGYKIEVLEGYYFDDLEYIFDEFVNKCEKLEKEQKALGSGSYIVYKILRNSLYGKFAQRPESTTFYLSEKEPNDDVFPVFDKLAEPVPNLWQQQTIQEYGYIMPHWAMWITAGARAILTEMVMEIGPENVYYGDTDSVIVDRTALEHLIGTGNISFGSLYGEWKVEGKYHVFQSFAPKLYYGVKDVEKDVQEIELKHKGVPVGNISLEDMIKITKNNPCKVEFVRLNKAVRTLYNQSAVDQKRTVKVVPDGERWHLLDNGLVRPIGVNTDDMYCYSNDQAY